MEQSTARQHPVKKRTAAGENGRQAGAKSMTRVLAFFLSLSMGGTMALADKPVPPADADKIQAALKAWGCSGGKMEQEAEATGVYEVDDAKCSDGQYDIKLDKDFRVISITRD
jgi:hypothetical protein